MFVSTRPQAATQRLVQLPVVEHDIHRPSRLAYLHCVEQVVPLGGDFGEYPIDVSRAVFGDQCLRFGFRGRIAEQEDDVALCIRRQFDPRLQFAAAIKPCAEPLRYPRCAC